MTFSRRGLFGFLGGASAAAVTGGKAAAAPPTPTPCEHEYIAVDVGYSPSGHYLETVSCQNHTHSFTTAVARCRKCGSAPSPCSG